jgi:hypothetical protein
MAVVRCPSLPAAINTEKGEDKKRGTIFGQKAEQKTEGRVCLRGEELGQNRKKKGKSRGRRASCRNKKKGNQRLQNFGEGEKGSDREGSKTREGRKE